MAVSRFRSLSLLILACLMAQPAVARRQPVRLPQSAPVPEMLAERTPQPDIASQTETPTPEPRPDDAPQPASPPSQAPVPEAKPPEKQPSESKLPESKPDEPEKAEDKRPTPQPDPRSGMVAAEKMPAEEEACRKRLRAMGVAFEDEPAQHDAAAGCSIPYPVIVTSLGKPVELAPKAELNCAMAETLARFMADVVQPAAREIMGSEVAGVTHASAYVCRPRHNGAKMSEHAFGNALDIASFTLKDKSSVEVGLAPAEKQGKFLDRIRKAACGPFKTVLGPGSDADHETHLHLDLAPRRNGSTFCQ